MGILSRFWKNEEREKPLTARGEGKRLVIGNWKCHKTFDEARRWFDTFAEGYVASDHVDVVVAPTFICLENLARYVRELRLDNVYLAAQDISPFPRGSYTGAVAADLVKDLVDFAIVGHSDRRRYFHETQQDVANKVAEAVEVGLRPIVCVDQPYAMSQLMALGDTDCEGLIVAYGPVEALNVRIPESPEKVAESVNFIHEIHPKRTVIYGGSLTAENVGSYFSLANLSGVFVGAASLDAESFLQICASATLV